VRPSPARAGADRSQAFYDGCLVPKPGTRSPECRYGDAASATTVVLFGDSHAMQYFPALRRVSADRDWRLLVLTKSGCPSAEVAVYYRQRRRAYTECDIWRESTLRRIEDREHPALIVTSSSNGTAVLRSGRPLGPAQSRQALASGYVAMAARLVALGARVVAIRDPQQPPQDIPSCVARALPDPRRCAFTRRARDARADPVGAALRASAAVTLIDPADELCRRRLCPAVIDDVLVYRQGGHLTATFAATLAPWLARRLRGLL
jgi:hypothetical protein